MDRHNVSDEVTAENLAHLHQEDLKIQNQFGCRGLTYWFDDKRKTAFCLIEAPDAKALKQMHDKAHGQVPHQIIEVEASIVESFLGRIEDPVRSRNAGLNIINDPAFRTIMVISVKADQPEMGKSRVKKDTSGAFRKDLQKILKREDGMPVIQKEGYYLVSFKSVSHAVHAAVKILSLYKALNGHKAGARGKLSIGLNAGVPVTEKKQIFEDTIKLAERMCDLVKAEIIVSSEVKELYQSENLNQSVQKKGIRSLSPADEKFITLLMDHTEANWNNTHLQAEHFTRALGCSKSQLYRKLITLTGLSPNAFLQEYRLKEALKLLKKKTGNVSEIAFETGFGSPSYFTKCFRKYYGVLPAIYLHAAQ